MHGTERVLCSFYLHVEFKLHVTKSYLELNCFFFFPLFFYYWWGQNEGFPCRNLHFMPGIIPPPLFFFFLIRSHICLVSHPLPFIFFNAHANAPPSPLALFLFASALRGLREWDIPRQPLPTDRHPSARFTVVQPCFA